MLFSLKANHRFERRWVARFLILRINWTKKSYSSLVNEQDTTIDLGWQCYVTNFALFKLLLRTRFECEIKYPSKYNYFWILWVPQNYVNCKLESGTIFDLNFWNSPSR
jgi:hypothetical protein